MDARESGMVMPVVSHVPACGVQAGSEQKRLLTPSQRRYVNSRLKHGPKLKKQELRDFLYRLYRKALRER